MNSALISEILKDLNPYQREAVEHLEGPLLILAGSGSGKTRVITHRIAYLIEAYKVPPSNILGVTFTNKAAEEMKSRVERLIGVRATPWIKTFHATCARILREHIEKLPPYNKNFSILDESDQGEIITKIMRELDMPTDQVSPQLIASIIDRAKDDLIAPQEFLSKRAGEIDGFLLEIASRVYQRYQSLLEQSNALDFGDLIRLTVKLFQERLDLLNYYRDRFKFILIDEYQDTNFAQYILSRLLAEKYENICVVGDDDQAIFGWRGADVKNILRFEEDFPNAKIVELKCNYRSTQRILRTAHAVIKNNPLRREKVLQPIREEGEPIVLYSAADELDEAEYVARQIAHLWQSHKERLDEIAVLYRVNTLSRVLEESLIRWGIPYEVVRGLKFYERMEIKDILSYLRLIANPRDDLSLLRILNKPRRGIGDRTIKALQSYARSFKISLWEAIQQVVTEKALLSRGQLKKLDSFLELMTGFIKRQDELSPSALTEHLLNKTGYLNELASDVFGAEERLGNIRELLGQMREFERHSSVGGGLLEFLENIALFSEADGYNPESGRVALMTLHCAKGLEFKHVFIMGLEENILPHSRSLRDDSLEEERRLYYVGLTRAKDRVYLTYTHRRSLHGTVLFNAPSRFILEMPAEDLEVCGEWGTCKIPSL